MENSQTFVAASEKEAGKISDFQDEKLSIRDMRAKGLSKLLIDKNQITFIIVEFLADSFGNFTLVWPLTREEIKCDYPGVKVIRTKKIEIDDLVNCKENVFIITDRAFIHYENSKSYLPCKRWNIVDFTREGSPTRLKTLSEVITRYMEMYTIRGRSNLPWSIKIWHLACAEQMYLTGLLSMGFKC